MISSDLGDNMEVLVGSNYDSGTHLNFTVGVGKKGNYLNKSLDKVLTKDKIEVLELTLLTLVTGWLENNNV